MNQFSNYLYNPYLDFLDRRRFTYEADTIATQLPEIRRETIILNRPDSTPKVSSLTFMLGKSFSRHFEFLRKDLRCQDNLHEMSNPIF